MKKILVVLIMLVGTVFLGQPAVAAEGDEATAQVAPAPAEPAPAPVEEQPAPPAAEEAPAPVVEEEPAPVVEEQAAPTEAAEPVGEESPAKVAPAAKKSSEASAKVVAAAAPVKVWVCKYSGTPGVNEKLKMGKNPIEVSSNTISSDKDYVPKVGDYFPDAQGRSYVVQVGGSDPGVAACPRGDVDTVATPVAPIISPATCSAPGALTLPVTAGVQYNVSPLYTGAPGNYTVTPVALSGYVLDPAVMIPFNVTVAAQLSGQVDCPVIIDPDPEPVKKVWVCKYVGTPGVNEVLKSGKNPIEVSVNALPGAPDDPAVGDVFSDAQERSVVVALSPANPEPTVADCGAPIVPDPEVSAQTPGTTPPTCFADGAIVFPVTSGVSYSVLGGYNGPGLYIVSAAADDGLQLVGQSLFIVNVLAQLTGVACDGGGGGTDDPGDGGGTDDPGEGGSGGEDTPGASPAREEALLPDTGGVPLWLLLLGGSMTAAGVTILFGRRQVVHAYSSGAGPTYSLVLPPKAKKPGVATVEPSGRGLRGVLAAVVHGVRRLLGGRA